MKFVSGISTVIFDISLTDCEPRISSKACNLIKERRECLTSVDDRDMFKDSICGWAFGKPFSSGNRCEPVKWLESQGLKRDQDFFDCKNGKLYSLKILYHGIDGKFSRTTVPWQRSDNVSFQMVRAVGRKLIRVKLVRQRAEKENATKREQVY